MTGQRVKKYEYGTLASGTYTELWDGTDVRGNALSSGIYISRLTVGDLSSSRKLALLK